MSAFNLTSAVRANCIFSLPLVHHFLASGCCNFSRTTHARFARRVTRPFPWKLRHMSAGKNATTSRRRERRTDAQRVSFNERRRRGKTRRHVTCRWEEMWTRQTRDTCFAETHDASFSMEATSVIGGEDAGGVGRNVNTLPRRCVLRGDTRRVRFHGDDPTSYVGLERGVASHVGGRGTRHVVTWRNAPSRHMPGNRATSRHVVMEKRAVTSRLGVATSRHVVTEKRAVTSHAGEPDGVVSRGETRRHVTCRRGGTRTRRPCCLSAASWAAAEVASSRAATS